MIISLSLIYFNIKEVEMANLTSKKVLLQLEQNQTLRMELFRVKTDIRDQRNHFLSCIVNQQMLAEKVLTELTLSARRCRESRDYKQSFDMICSSVKRSIEDLSSIIEGYQSYRSQWEKSKCDDASKHYEKQLNEYSKKYELMQMANSQLKLENSEINKQNDLCNQQLQFLQDQLQNLQSKYQKSLKEQSITKGKVDQFCLLNQQLSIKIKNYSEQIQKLKLQNEQLCLQLRQSRQMSNKHTNYLSIKCENVERQNKQLIQRQRQYFLLEQNLRAEIQQQLMQNQTVQMDKQALKQQLKSLKGNLKDIIEKEEKIKFLETLKLKKGSSKISLCESNCENRMEYSQEGRKQVGKLTKKFNLQSFQQKLTTCNSTASFFVR